MYIFRKLFFLTLKCHFKPHLSASFNPPLLWVSRKVIEGGLGIEELIKRELIGSC